MIGFSVTTPLMTIDSFYQQVDTPVMLETAASDFARLFYSHQGRLVHKWGHYLDIYDRHFRGFRQLTRPVRLLEIGVSHGGSLALWRKYFGPKALIFGIDINPRCREIADPDICIRIGSQADGEFLKKVVDEMGGIDIVIDDGSHVASHQRKSLEVLFPLLDSNGVYVAEDLHTSYFRGFFEGGLGRRGTFIEETKTLIDAIHDRYHKKKSHFPYAHEISGLYVYDSLVVIEKGTVQKRFHTKVGTPSF